MFNIAIIGKCCQIISNEVNVNFSSVKNVVSSFCSGIDGYFDWFHSMNYQKTSTASSSGKCVFFVIKSYVFILPRQSKQLNVTLNKV